MFSDVSALFIRLLRLVSTTYSVPQHNFFFLTTPLGKWIPGRVPANIDILVFSALLSTHVRENCFVRLFLLAFYLLPLSRDSKGLRAKKRWKRREHMTLPSPFF